jgi:hypothetical protein
MERLTKRSEHNYVCWNGNPDLTTNKRYSILLDRLALYEDTELTPEQVATLKAENEMLKSLTSDIPLDRLEEICKAEKEDRILILPKCPKCGLVNAWGYCKKYCDRCGANLNGGDV